MDFPGLLVTVLGLALIAAVSWLVVACQRAALVRAELAAARGRVGVLERSQEARRRSVVALAEVALAGWVGDGITVRWTVRVRQDRGSG